MLDEVMLKRVRNYRDETERKGGIVLVFDNEIYGWKDKLRNPENEMPGAIGVDEAGNQYEASGGDDYSGAKEWVMLST